MAKRSRAREVALQLLYQHDHVPTAESEQIRAFLHRRLRDSDLEQFAAGLYDGVLTHRPEIDQRLAAVAENWSVERMAVVDRNILRLSAFELLFQPQTPPRVAIDEAVEMAKRYGTAESAAFVNGILDRLAAGRLAAEAVPPPGAGS
jgi:transcription antitermination protein NusB